MPLLFSTPVFCVIISHMEETPIREANFVHLHNHTDYSLLDGAAPIAKYVEKAKAEGMKALAITDHGNMYGALRFYKA